MDSSFTDATPLLGRLELHGGTLSSKSLLAISAILLALTYIYYHAFNLRHIPGPFLARFTGLQALYQTMNLNRTKWIHTLHQRYGPIVRLGPNEVSINDVDALTPVYNFEKTYFYEAFECYGKKNMFSSLDRWSHAPRRKNLGAEYSRTNVLRQESLAMLYDRAHQMVDLIVPDRTIDVFPLVNYMTQDIISGFFFGDKNGSHCLQGEDTDFFASWHLRRSTFHWFAELPTIANLIYNSRLVEYIPMWRDAAKGEKRLIEIYDKWMGKLDPRNSHLYSKLFMAGYTHDEIGAEVMDHMGAGHETSGTTLTFLIDLLSKQPEIQAKLREELRDADIEDFSALDKLPYLEGVLSETFRLYASIPASQPRIVPTGGTKILGYDLPGGCTISAQAYSLHRDPANFSSPEEFIPERWFDPGQKTKYSIMTFGKGTRGCLGKHIATVTLKVTIALLYKKSSSHKPDVVPVEEDMDFKDYYMITPVGDTCSIVFTPN